METAWRFRIMLFMAFAIIIFGDMLGYGSVKSDRNSNGNHHSRRQAVDATSTSATLKNQHRPNIDLNDGELWHVQEMLVFSFVSIVFYVAWSSNVWFAYCQDAKRAHFNSCVLPLYCDNQCYWRSHHISISSINGRCEREKQQHKPWAQITYIGCGCGDTRIYGLFFWRKTFDKTQQYSYY